MNDIELLREGDLSDFLFDAPVKKGERFEVKTAEHALWCEGKIDRAEGTIQRNLTVYQKAKKKLEEWLASANKESENTVNAMMALMRPWVEREVASGKKKSVNLLSHRVGFRSGQDSVEVLDEDSAVFALEAAGHEECINTKKTVLKTETKKLLQDGLLIEGVKLVEAGEKERTYYIEPME